MWRDRSLNKSLPDDHARDFDVRPASSHELPHAGHAMLLRSGIDCLAERNRLQIVPAADLRLGSFFECTQQLCHGAYKGVGKPNLLPARLKPRARLFSAGEIERAWHPCRIARPTYGASGEAFRTFHSPTNADVAFTSRACRAGPNVVPRRGSTAIFVFEDVEVDAVAVRKTRARIRTRAGQDALRRAEPVAERVQMVNAHHEGGQGGKL